MPACGGERLTIWHQTNDARASARLENGAWWLDLEIGTWPIESGQSVLAEAKVSGRSEVDRSILRKASWSHNSGVNSYWSAKLGPFAAGDSVDYSLSAQSPRQKASVGPFQVRIGPKLFLAILWHQHQPSYADRLCATPKGRFLFPWVPLHALRDYYSMASLLERHPKVHLTINLTPVLLRQIEDYVERGFTDRALELTHTPTPELSSEDREELAKTFFDADWHNEIYPHPRYKELFDKRGRGQPLTDADITDLRMWFNLAWFAPEFQRDEVTLPDQTIASVRRFLEKGAGFGEQDIAGMVAEQVKIMRNIVAIHRKLQNAGQIEVSTTPFYHPILPLLHDTDKAVLDRDGTELPTRFSFPEDADAQVGNACAFYFKLFSRPPRGMWPAEGAVGESVVGHFRNHGVRWIATDKGVLARSGEWGYDA